LSELPSERAARDDADHPHDELAARRKARLG
jgi:hypothetical protein